MLKGAYMRADPIGQIAELSRVRIGVAASAQYSYKQVGGNDLPRCAIGERDGVARVIDKHLLAGAVLLP